MLIKEDVINMDEELINSVIKPFVVEQKYGPVPGYFYISSSNTVRTIALTPGTKIFYCNKEECLKTSEELANVNSKNRVAYNSDSGLWSIAIINPNDCGEIGG